MKRLVFTVLASLALLGTAQAQTAAAPAKPGLASDQAPFAASTRLVADRPAEGKSTHFTLASDSPAPAPTGAAASVRAADSAAGPPSLANLPSNQGLH